MYYSLLVIICLPYSMEIHMDEEKWFDRAKRLMKKKKISMEEMGKHLNLGQSSMSMKLSGKRDSSLDDVKNIAKVLGVSIAELVDGTDDFIISNDEKMYLNIYRNMSDLEKEVFHKIMQGLNKP